MVIGCPECNTRYRVDGSKIATGGRALRCGKCSHVFRVQPPSPTDPTAATIAVSPPTPHLAGMAAAPAPSPAGQAAAGPSVSAPRPEGRDLAPGPGDEAAWLLEADGGEERVDRRALRDRIRSGEVAEDTLLRPAAGGDPVPAGDVAELQRYFRLKRGGGVAVVAAGAATSAINRCDEHPARPVEHICTGCGSRYCSTCVTEKQFGNTRVKWCDKCDDRCVPFEGAQEITPFWKEIRRLLIYPLEGWAPFMVLCCAFLAGMGRWLPGPGKILYFFVLAYQLHILSESARGKKHLPDWPDMSNLWQISARGLKAVLVSLVAWLPVIAFNFFVFSYAISGISDEMATSLSAEVDAAASEEGEIHIEDYADENGDVDFERYLADLQAQQGGGAGEIEMGGGLASLPQTGALFLLGNLLLVPLVALYYPMCLMIAAIFNTVLPALNPALIVRCIGRIKADYAIALLFCGVLGLGGALAQLIFSIIPLAGAVLASLIGAYLTFIQMHILGWTAHQGWNRLNWDIQI